VPQLVFKTPERLPSLAVRDRPPARRSGTEPDVRDVADIGAARLDA